MIFLKYYSKTQGMLVSDDLKEYRHIYNNMSYKIPNAIFIPAVKEGRWDGVYRHIHGRGIFDIGLVEEIVNICKSADIKYQVESRLSNQIYSVNFSKESFMEFIKPLAFYSKGNRIYPREDQLNAIYRACSMKRCINICPTSFGKSLCITIECLWHIKNNKKIIIIVPTKDLVRQFDNDIKDYSNGMKEPWYPKVQILDKSENDVEEDSNICISTWQLLQRFYTKNKDFMNQFSSIIVDECHGAKAAVLNKIIKSAVDCEYRTGWTGTLVNKDDDKFAVIEQLGPYKQIITTSELMDKNIVAKLEIVICQVKYPEYVRKDVSHYDYINQEKYIEGCVERSRKILEIANYIDKTGIMFFKKIEHGTNTFNLAREMYPNKNIYLIHANHYQMNDKKYKSFEELKVEIEKDKNGIILANYQLCSTGINLKNLHWLCFYVSTKSFIRTVQSIGRGLRISDTKHNVMLIDVTDDLSYKRKTNYSIYHFQDRLQIYKENGFKIKNKSYVINLDTIQGVLDD